MHSRIFQLSKEPIQRDDYIDSCWFDDHWFTNEIADYVAGCDRSNAIMWLTNWIKGCKIEEDGNGFYLVIKNKDEYFASAYEDFKKHLNNVKNCTLAEFAKGTFYYDLWALKESHNNRFGFYVYSDALMPFDDFIRTAEMDCKYYIGNALDYHS